MMKPPSPRMGSMTMAAVLWAPICLTTRSSRALRPPSRSGRGRSASEGSQGAVDLGAKGPKPSLVGDILGGHRHGQQGAAVVGVAEGDDRRAMGGDPAILTAFSTASAPVENSATFGVRAGVLVLSHRPPGHSRRTR